MQTVSGEAVWIKTFGCVLLWRQLQVSLARGSDVVVHSGNLHLQRLSSEKQEGHFFFFLNPVNLKHFVK